MYSIIWCMENHVEGETDFSLDEKGWICSDETYFCYLFYVCLLLYFVDFIPLQFQPLISYNKPKEVCSLSLVLFYKQYTKNLNLDRLLWLKINCFAFPLNFPIALFLNHLSKEGRLRIFINYDKARMKRRMRVLKSLY